MHIAQWVLVVVGTSSLTFGHLLRHRDHRLHRGDRDGFLVLRRCKWYKRNVTCGEGAKAVASSRMHTAHKQARTLATNQWHGSTSSNAVVVMQSSMFATNVGEGIVSPSTSSADHGLHRRSSRRDAGTRGHDCINSFRDKETASFRVEFQIQLA